MRLWLHKRFEFETFTFFLKLGIFIHGIGLAETNGEMTYRGFGYVVDSCPTSEIEFISAATRLNCSEDQYGRNQYTCVPNEDRSALVEFCYSKIVGFYQKGHCLITRGYGTLDQISCHQFKTGCPEENFRGTGVNKFPACSRINTEKQCFYADPSCSKTTNSNSFDPSTTIDFLNTTTNSMVNILTTETVNIDQESSFIGVIVGIILGVLLLLSLPFAFMIWKRRKSRIRRRYQMYYAVEMKESNFFTKEIDDEVTVLFCFLCSDSVPPDFTDTEWLDLLNEIRRRVYCNPVTREEAQQTLDRLKSRDCLWEDQDELTKDKKDDTMYKISLMDSIIQFSYSSYDTARVYLTSNKYGRKTGEKRGIYYHGDSDSLLIRRLQTNILNHVTTDICNKVPQILMIPKDIVQGNETERNTYLEELKKTGKSVHYKGRCQDSKDHVTWLWRYGRPDIVRSCIGLHPHWDIYIIDNKAYWKPNQYHQYSPAVRCLLYGILLVDQYTFEVHNESHKEVLNKLRETYFTELPVFDEINVSNIRNEITNKLDGSITFISDGIRHEVMYAFVTECLVEDSDLAFFLTTASRDVISEYCRSWYYERNEGERCLYVPNKPEEMYDLFIDKLLLDIIIHCTMSDNDIHNEISRRLKIPIEVMKWDINAKKRFIEISNQGSKNMCRARGMIVGCAGAGKTTLLRQLQRKQISDCPSSIKTTVGLEIHENLFEVKDDTLIDFNSEKENTEDEINETESQGEQVISMTDFAGQVAYYACHQIYLSRRAFYLVVMDMSKGLDDVVHTQDTDRHNPKGSLFHGWAYNDYFLFWLRSIKTYCEERNREETTNSPVILIASHLDCVKNRQGIERDQSFYTKLEKCLPEEHTLKGLISTSRYYEIECPQGDLNEHQEERIENVRKCIVRTARSLSHWGEKIPIKWSMFEKFIRENKEKKMEILSRKELLSKMEFKLTELEKDDMLRYFKEIGLIIYFAEKGLRENIIINVQWFVDAFKNIITDPTHAEPFCERVKEWDIFIKTGRISDQTLVKIWGKNSSYVSQKDIIIPYMEKLGILAIVRTEEAVGKEKESINMRPVYYIPSINKTEFTEECREIMEDVNKTPVLAFSFKTYIPHFFFFRLVALCFSLWEPLREDLLCKNVAFYKDKGGDRFIAIAVNKTSIQLQVFTPDKKIQLKNDRTKKIRTTIEKMMNDITSTFHHQVLYEVGYTCKDINITDEDEDYFLSETEVAQLSTNKRICPNNLSRKNHEKHDIVRDDLLYYWYTENQ